MSGPVTIWNKLYLQYRMIRTLFVLMMISYFDNPSKRLMYYLHHDNPHIRRLAVKAVGNLKIFKILPFLKKRYKSETTRTRIEILKVLAKIGTPLDLRFLNELLKTDNPQELFYAIKAMSDIHTKNTTETYCTIHEQAEAEEFEGAASERIPEPSASC